MKNLYLPFLLLLVLAQIANAQLNVTFISNLDYGVNVNDIWGYAAPDETEYALLGVQNGTAIISLEDPANPIEVAWIPGVSSTWRDIKVWGNYAYVTTGSGSDGLTIIDLSNLPASVNTTYKTDFGSFGTLNNCHNIWMDEFGYAYITGCNFNSGGVVILDCSANQADPPVVGSGPAVYAHDVFTQNNRMYTSDIYQGSFGVYDVTDKSNVTFMGSQPTLSSFTHNAWASVDGNYLFTTDEVAGAYIGSYDVSDPSDIQTLDQFRPIATDDNGVIPHNVHVYQNWLIASYYVDGCIIVDATDPSNLIEVGNFDTYLGTQTGFSGSWGAYPYLPSGHILVSDRGTGLYVLEPNYVQACRLEGVVTDSITGLPLTDVYVEIQASQENFDLTNPSGAYETGIATAGTYDVTYSVSGYQSKTYSVVLDNGVLTIQDAKLLNSDLFTVSAQVVSSVSGAAIPNAEVVLSDDSYIYTAITDANGNFSLPTFFTGDFTGLAGKWGFHTKMINENISTWPSDDAIIELDEGYKDEFILDLGWSTQGTASEGFFVREVPMATFYQNDLANVDFDIANDLGEECYVTGNSGELSNFVQDGNVVLTSPSMDLSSYSQPVVSCHAYFFNEIWVNNTDQSLNLSINNGITTVLLETIYNTTNGWTNPLYYKLNDYIDITADMTFIVETTNEPGSPAIVEAGFDLFEVRDAIDYLDFISSPTNGCLPHLVSFLDPGTDATSWSWTFEGGDPATSTEQDPIVTYNNVGTYSVSLIVTLPNGLAINTQNDLVIVNQLPTSSFTYNITDATVDFDNTSTDALSYTWDFGDGSSSTEENPSHTFANGTYTVTLTAENDCGPSEWTETISIDVTNVQEINQLFHLEATPNPFTDLLRIQYELPEGVALGQLNVYNLLGQQVIQRSLANNSGMILLEETLQTGVYLVRIEAEGNVSLPLKVVKN